jgi:hypothetical protein
LTERWAPPRQPSKYSYVRREDFWLVHFKRFSVIVLSRVLLAVSLPWVRTAPAHRLRF